MAYTACKLTYRSRSRSLAVLLFPSKHSEVEILTMAEPRVQKNGYANSISSGSTECRRTRRQSEINAGPVKSGQKDVPPGPVAAVCKSLGLQVIGVYNPNYVKLA